ncbi:MAG TPA: L-threonylcarbamoyladenylate synthase [Spirochaetota bacterium]|nr:L-threonylcarbamoyladenylate synthase [Spirochaetota bacterium]HQP48353.1 L-threonylcarbamoyladenylate synthase [Spirochaetota bacterium]
MIAAATDENIRNAAKIIAAGGLVAFPTETVYGLGADAMNPIAAAKIFEVKNRPFFDPLIVHIPDMSWVGRLAADIHARAAELMKAFWPGPLTIVVKKNGTVPDILTAGLDTVALRMPSHPVALALLRYAGTPVAAPSANPFGYLSPTTAGHVEAQLGGSIDMILDGGPCSVGIESTIIRVDVSGITLLRAGGTPVEAIESVAGKISTAENSPAPQAPGQLPYHYSPHTPVKIIEDISEAVQPDSGLLSLYRPEDVKKFRSVEVLSEKGDLTEAAAGFFNCLHNLDAAGCGIIYALKLPEEGLGRAIMERLRKAAAKPI